MSSAGGAPFEMALDDSQATEDLGTALARGMPGGKPALVLALSGDLGAGKSTLARALLRGLGVEGPIRSPTYTLVEPYSTASGECLHLDLYRLADPAELDFLGLDEQHAGAVLWLVEWPQRGGDRLPPADLMVELIHVGPARSARIRPASERGEDWCRRARLTAS